MKITNRGPGVARVIDADRTFELAPGESAEVAWAASALPVGEIPCEVVIDRLEESEAIKRGPQSPWGPPS